MWTHFYDMHSGGRQKEKWSHIFIEAPEEEAIVIFYNRFGHNPNKVTCTCCGQDYSISSGELEEVSDYYTRNNPTFLTNDSVLVIYGKDITPEERIGDVPIEGYVWV